MSYLISDIELYDKAVYNYLKEIEHKIVYAPTDRASYTLVKRNTEYNDKTMYPYISFYRDPSFPIDHNRYSNQAIRGHYTRLTHSTADGSRTARYVHSIPVTLTYQVDLWGIRSTDVLELSQSLLTKLTITNPVLFVPMNPDGEMGRFHILDVSPVDNSDVESEESIGKIYRHTYTFTINAWIKHVVDKKTTPWKCPSIEVVDDISIYD